MTRYGHTVEWNDSGLILTTSKGYRMLLTDADTGFDGDILIETQAGQSLEFDDLLNTVTLNVNQDFYAYVMEQALVDCGNFQLNAAQEIGMNAGADVTITSGAAMTLDAGADLTVNVGEDTSFDMAGDMDIKLAGALILNAAVTADLNITGAVSLLLGANLNIAVTGKATLGATGGLTIISPANIAIQFAQLMLGTGVEPYVKGATFLAFLEQFVAWAQLHQHVSATPGTPTSPAIIPVPVVPDILSETILGQ